MRVIWENVRGQMVVRVNGNSEHYNGYVGNKSLPKPLSRATYASTAGAAGAVLAHVQHISGDLSSSTDFYPRGERVHASLFSSRATEKFVNLRRALAPL